MSRIGHAIAMAALLCVSAAGEAQTRKLLRA